MLHFCKLIYYYNICYIKHLFCFAELSLAFEMRCIYYGTFVIKPNAYLVHDESSIIQAYRLPLYAVSDVYLL